MIATDDLAPLAAAADRFARDVVAPRRAALDSDGSAVDEVLAVAAELGMLSLCAPAAAGGLDADADAVCAVVRPIARVDAGIAAAILIQATAQQALAAAWPANLGADELLAWAGANGAPLRIDAGRAYGEAPLVPLATRARWLVASAPDALACCALDGASRTPASVLGLAACAPADVRLAGARVIATAPPGDDPTMWASLPLAALALGLIEGTFATALDYARHRRQGGRAILGWPEVRRLLATLRESAALIDAALDAMLARRRRGDLAWRWDAITLGLRATDAARLGTSDGVQLLGGNGYMKDYPQERRLRDARQLRCLLGPAADLGARAFDAWLAATNEGSQARYCSTLEATP